MFQWIDNILNRVTMYRLVLYILSALIGIALIYSLFGWVAFGPGMMLYSVVFMLIICWITNTIFAKVFQAPANTESIYITAFILVLIITPPKNIADSSYLMLAGWASVWAIASKFIIAIRKKHLFNPVAFSVALLALTVGLSASWWIGTRLMVVPVVIASFLIAKKIRRFDLVGTFLIAATISVIASSWLGGGNLATTASRLLLESPLFFFAGVMLTEPMTTPPTKRLRLWYSALVGLLYSPNLHIGPIYSTPELALIVGNIFSYVVSPKETFILTLKQIKKVTTDVYDFLFDANRHVRFRPGQYLEWTLAHSKADSRGIRRYFTIASAPTEERIRIGVKFSPSSSTFKSELLALKVGDQIVASQLAGDFVLPKDAKVPLVFLAGGIGITPFRSMIQYLIDEGERRSIIIIYSNKTEQDIAYRDVLTAAEKKLGVKVFHTLTDENIPPSWSGKRGYITDAMIKECVPDFQQRTFYISGPHAFVVSCEKNLKKLGLSSRQIKKDYFPGLA